MPMADFKHWKEQRLSRADASRKGSVDEPIEGIVRLLNGRETFCTTSSCSGRVVVLEQPPAAHSAALTALQKAAADAIFKFEPFVLHVQCQDLQDAQLLHTVAIEAGFRNSGITVSRKGKIMMAVRSTHCLEVPLTQKGRLMVSEEYVDFVVQVANRKMEENGKRIDRFYSSLKFALENRNHSKSSSEEKEKGNGMDPCGRKKSQATKKDGGSPSSDKNQSLESEDSSQSNTNIFH
ncbi:tRNA wybutosine-synthesizing protein 3 homolog isoform 4-T4 [Liasis olivaceus]